MPARFATPDGTTVIDVIDDYIPSAGSQPISVYRITKGGIQGGTEARDLPTLRRLVPNWLDLVEV